MKALDEHLFVGSYGDLNFQVDEFKAFFDSLEDHYDEAALKKYLDSLGIF